MNVGTNIMNISTNMMNVGTNIFFMYAEAVWKRALTAPSSTAKETVKNIVDNVKHKVVVHSDVDLNVVHNKDHSV